MTSLQKASASNMIFTYHYVSTMSGEPTPFFCINQLFLSASNVAQAPSKRRGNSKGDIIYRYILIILLYIHQLFPWHVKSRRHHHGVSMCIDCFSVFPYQTGAKIAINCMGKNVHVFPHILRRGSPQICKSSHKWVPQLPLRGRSRTGSAAVGLGPAGWGWTRLPARKVAGPPMG